MSKIKSNSQILLDGLLKDYKEVNNFETDNVTFDFYSMEQVLKNYESSFELIDDSIIDGGNDGGIDSILFYINQVPFYSLEELKEKFSKGAKFEIKIIQNKNSESINEDVLTRWLSTLGDIFSLSKELGTEYSEGLKNKANLIREIWIFLSSKHEKLSVNLIYISRGQFNNLSTSFNNKKSQIEKIFTDNQININIDLIGSDELLDLSRKKEDYSSELEFTQFTNSKSGDGYIGFVTLSNYIKCITDENENLRDIFEDNVRDQLKSEVNDEIMETIRGDSKKSFWCLNNGVTIISSKIAQVGNTLNMKNIQVVNGLQTSYQIFNGFKEGVNFGDDNYLIVKVVQTEDEDLRNRIIKATNRQTPVEISGFRALDKIQLDIEDYFKKNGYYYDRRKNFYKNQGQPSNKIISIQLLAQCIFSMVHKDPSTARSKPVSLLKEQENYKKSFLDLGDNLWLFYNSIILFKKVDEKLRILKNKYKEDKTKGIERIVSANFKFHVCRITFGSLLGPIDYKIKDIIESKNEIEKEINSDSINNKIDESFEKLVKIINQYLNENQKTEYDLISISKNPSFNKEVTLYLENEQNNKTLDEKI